MIMDICHSIQQLNNLEEKKLAIFMKSHSTLSIMAFNNFTQKHLQRHSATLVSMSVYVF